METTVGCSVESSFLYLLILATVLKEVSIVVTNPQGHLKMCVYRHVYVREIFAVLISGRSSRFWKEECQKSCETEPVPNREVLFSLKYHLCHTEKHWKSRDNFWEIAESFEVTNINLLTFMHQFLLLSLSKWIST